MAETKPLGWRRISHLDLWFPHHSATLLRFSTSTLPSDQSLHGLEYAQLSLATYPTRPSVSGYARGGQKYAPYPGAWVTETTGEVEKGHRTIW